MLVLKHKSLVWYGKSDSSGIQLVPLLCTDPTLLQSVGPQITLAYSKCEHIKHLYSMGNV